MASCSACRDGEWRMKRGDILSDGIFSSHHYAWWSPAFMKLWIKSLFCFACVHSFGFYLLNCLHLNQWASCLSLFQFSPPANCEGSEWVSAWGLVTSWTETTRGRKTGIQSNQWIFLRRAKGITGFDGVSTCLRDRSPDLCASSQDFLYFALSIQRGKVVLLCKNYPCVLHWEPSHLHFSFLPLPWNSSRSPRALTAGSLPHSSG